MEQTGLINMIELICSKQLATTDHCCNLWMVLELFEAVMECNYIKFNMFNDLMMFSVVPAVK